MNFLEKFVDDCHNRLLSASFESEPFSYILGRGVSEEQIKKYKIGYFEGDIPVREETQDFDNFNRWAGYGKNLQKRLIFPSHNAHGFLRGIDTRRIDVKDYTKFMLARAQVDAVFFGLNEEALSAIWKTKTVYLTEGIFDHFPIQRLYPNSLCCMTAKVSRQQFQFLERFVDRINVLFDMDEAGKALGAALEKRLKLKDVTLFKFPNHDISQMWEDWGESRFANFIAKEVKKRTVDFG